MGGGIVALTVLKVLALLRNVFLAEIHSEQELPPRQRALLSTMSPMYVRTP